MRETIAIVGSHPRTRGQFDFKRNDCDIWVFNEAMSQEWATRADGVFQLHIPVIWRNPQNRNDPKHYEWLKSGNTPPVFMQKRYEDVPNSVHFPKDNLLSFFSNGKINGKPIREVTCSPSWALAYAIYLGYSRIEIYGVELESNTEYAYQQGNFKYWCGVAVGRGIDLQIFNSMFDAPLYGYEGEVFIPYETFQNRIDELLPKRNELTQKYTAIAKNVIELVKQFASDNMTKEIMPAVQEYIQAAMNLGELDGAIQENNRYKSKADAMREQGGEFVFSRQEFEAGAAGTKNKAEELEAKLNSLKGQLDIIHASVINSAKDSPKREKVLDVYRSFLAEFVKSYNVYGLFRGAMAENFAYMARLDAGIKAAGGEKSERVILESVMK